MRYFLIILFFLPAVSFADQYFPALQYKCSHDDNKIYITNVGSYQEKGHYIDLDRAVINPWSLVTIKGDDHPVITKQKSETLSCSLKNGKYTVSIQPLVYSRKILGRCGATISSYVSVEKDGKSILAKTAIEDNCLDKPPKIKRITIDDSNGKVELSNFD